MTKVIKIFNPSKEEFLYNILNSLGIKCSQIVLTENKFFDTYDLTLDPGIRTSKLDRVMPDIGLALKSHSCPRGSLIMREGLYRIQAQKKELDFKDFDILHNQLPSTMYSPVALGVDIDDNSLFVDLNTLPNLLIGGIPGSGKSILLHSIILSLLKSNSDLYLIDPKMVEFHIYKDHQNVSLLGYSIDDVRSAIEIIQNEINDRFEFMRAYGCRNVQEVNERSHSKKLNPLILVIDEWGDIALQDKKISKTLCAIAQKGRAAGLSIILATQRPSSEVISGLIKASFSGRIALKTASAIDSRIIIEQGGAEKLSDIGMGLYLDQKLSAPTLFRSPFLSDLDNKVQPSILKTEITKPPKTFWESLWS